MSDSKHAPPLAPPKQDIRSSVTAILERAQTIRKEVIAASQCGAWIFPFRPLMQTACRPAAAYVLPSLKVLWLAMRWLGVGGVPAFVGEPKDAEAALALLDVVDTCCTEHQELTRAAPPVPNRIRRCGGIWEINYGGEQGKYADKDYKALATVAKLVAQPNRAQSLSDLANVDTRALLEQRVSQDDVVDQKGIGRLHERYEKLMREKEGEKDPLVQRENEEELAKIVAALKTAVGPGGRKRKLGTTAADKVWDALSKSLRRLWPRLRNDMPALAAHLQAAIRFDRPHVTYQPQADAPPWETEM